MFNLPESEIVPALKFPPPSRFNMAPGTLRVLAVLPSVTVPFAAVAVMSPFPVMPSTPVLVRVVVPPRATVPPPERPGPELTVIELFASWELAKEPATCIALIVPLKLLAVVAKMAYGAGVMGCLGVRVVKLGAPLVRTASSSQTGFPVNTPWPKSKLTVKRPAFTYTALFVTAPARFAPLEIALNTLKVMSKLPVAGNPDAARWPWYMKAVPWADVRAPVVSKKPMATSSFESDRPSVLAFTGNVCFPPGRLPFTQPILFICFEFIRAVKWRAFLLIGASNSVNSAR